MAFFGPKHYSIWQFCLKWRFGIFFGVHHVNLFFGGACAIHFGLLSSSPTWINRTFEFKSFHPQFQKEKTGCLQSWTHHPMSPSVNFDGTSTKSAERSSVKAFNRSKIQVETCLRFNPLPFWRRFAPRTWWYVVDNYGGYFLSPFRIGLFSTPCKNSIFSWLLELGGPS